MRPKRKPLGFISKTILLFNGIAVFFLLMSYLAPVVRPQTFWPIAFLGIAYPFFLGVNILFILVWLFRKPSFALISLITIVIGWTAVEKNIGFNSVANEVERDTGVIRVMSYNVRMFNTDSDDGMRTQQDIIDIIKEVSPDVLCIQEFYTKQKGKDDIKKYFLKELGFKFSNFTAVAQNNYDAYGIAIFSKYPITNSGNLPINIDEKIVNRIVYSDLEKDGKSFRVYNVHLQSVAFRKEDYEYIRQDAPSGNVDVQSTRRIGRRLKWAYFKRNDQIDLLSAHTAESEIPYIVAGDFNDTPLSYAVNKLSSNMQNAFVKKGRGFGVTYNGAFPNFQIDYIFASKEFDIQNFQIIRKKLSDHYPIWSDLRL